MNKSIKETKVVSTNSYKGVRDFYPKDWLFQKWLFKQMSLSAELFGYENYNASPLEYSELYIAKSGQEIVQNETYNFVDRGGRNVTIRPELTPTLARMIAAQERELPKPIRWYSIPNLFRYEKPQRGRLREHYQFNADIFGIEGIEAEIELIEMGAKILENMGLSLNDFEIKINNRKIINPILNYISYSTMSASNIPTSEDEANEVSKYIKSTSYELSKLIDKKNKLTSESFDELLSGILKNSSKSIGIFNNFINTKSLEGIKEIIENFDWVNLEKIESENLEKTHKLITTLQEKGFKNVAFDLTLMRGFDYYTDIIFEFFDTNPENNRSMFGGGRYDDLLDIFGKEKIPAVGFGMGDVTAKDSLEIRGLLPKLKSKTTLTILPLEKEFNSEAEKFATQLRIENINTEIDFSNRKLTKKINSVEKKEIEFFIVFGENEIENKKYTVKNIFTKEKFENISLDKTVEILKK